MNDIPVIPQFLEAAGTVGTPFEFTITATNSPMSFDATGLPLGLSVDTFTGAISGTPQEDGVFDVVLEATNADGTGTTTLRLQIEPAPLVGLPVITSPLTATARQGVWFSYTITATGDPPIIFEATEMPAGLSINETTGVISGVPVSDPGLWHIPISATNAVGTATATLALTLQPALPPAPIPEITSPDTATGTVGLPFTYVITARNAPTQFYATGLPDGLAINTHTGSILGTPREQGTYHVQLEARNAGGTGTMMLVLVISPTPDERPCPPPPHVKSTSGPDVPGILCYIPDGCCGPLPCQIDEFAFICQIRSLLPEGDPYNNTARPIAEVPPQYGAVTVGCARVGCEQMVLGSCCEMEVIPCEVDPVAPQLAVVDTFGAAAYKVVLALCEMLLELDPCTTKRLIRQWATRMGIKHPDPCGSGWSDRILIFLICFITQLRYNQTAVNWEYLTSIASRMGADIKLRYAGAFNETANSDAPLPGWWSLARDAQHCPPRDPCPPDPEAQLGGAYEQAKGGQAMGEVACAPPNENSPLSLNVIVCPSDIIIPENCNLPTPPAYHLPHDREMYEAFWWLLPQILPRGPLYCIYECCPADCIA